MAEFLGVLIGQDNEETQYILTQTGLINRIINASNIEGAKGRCTPADFGALSSDKDGDACNEPFNYKIVVGILLYLSGHTCP